MTVFSAKMESLIDSKTTSLVDTHSSVSTSDHTVNVDSELNPSLENKTFLVSLEVKVMFKVTSTFDFKKSKIKPYGRYGRENCMVTEVKLHQERLVLGW